MACSLTPTTGGVIVRTPFDASFVSAFKLHIPNSERKYDPNGRTWTVSSAYAGEVAHLIERHFGENVAVPASVTKPQSPVMRLLDVRYIGSCKDRTDGTKTASGWSKNEWSVIFPEQVLRAWFEAGDNPNSVNTNTLYSVIGARQGMTAEELKTAYRRAALTWHPDRCKDVEAPEIFLKVQHAWETLSNPGKRERYDAGLVLQASLGKLTVKEDEWKVGNSYRSPLKSGLILAMGTDTIGRFVVEKIHAWEDLIDSQGRSLVTSWPMGAKQPTEIWV